MKIILGTSVLFLALALGIEHLAAARAGSLEPRIEKLLELPAGSSVAALTLASPELGAELVYVRAKGLWRSREAAGAVCDEARIEALIAACTQARGEELSRDPAREAHYGLDAPARLSIALHGPKFLERDDRDVLASLEFGPGFARRAGAPEILAIDRDPRALLASAAAGLPPFVDTRLLAGCFDEDFAGFRSIALEYADGRRFELTTQPPKSPEDPPEWTLTREGQSESALVWRPGGYTSLWIRARAKGFANPKQAPSLGLEHPFLRVTLVPTAGATIQMCVSERSIGNEFWLWNRRTNVLMRLDGGLFGDVTPGPTDFTDAARANPWERWLAR
ncbi:MAG: hypothetical protein IPJ19_11165 [Planctomycetes bacterium]|nr:hypothetical protein [Planctomycetota bacterium]